MFLTNKWNSTDKTEAEQLWTGLNTEWNQVQSKPMTTDLKNTAKKLEESEIKVQQAKLRGLQVLEIQMLLTKRQMVLEQEQPTQAPRILR